MKQGNKRLLSKSLLVISFSIIWRRLHRKLHYERFSSSEYFLCLRILELQFHFVDRAYFRIKRIVIVHVDVK